MKSFKMCEKVLTSQKPRVFIRDAAIFYGLNLLICYMHRVKQIISILGL